MQSVALAEDKKGPAVMEKGVSGLRRLSHDGGCWIKVIAFSHDGRLVASGDTRGHIAVWDRGTGDRRADLIGHARAIESLAFSPDGSQLASGAVDGTLLIHETKKYALSSRLIGHSGPVDSLVFAPDGKALVSATSMGDATVKVWDAVNGVARGSFAAEDQIFGFKHVTMNRDGLIVAVEGRGKLDLLAFPNLALVKQKPCTTSNIVCVSDMPHTRRLAIADTNGSISVWEPDSLMASFEFAPGPEVLALFAFSLDERSIVVRPDGPAGDEDALLFIDVKTRKSKRLKLGTPPIQSLAFAPDGRELGIGCREGEFVLLPIGAGD